MKKKKKKTLSYPTSQSHPRLFHYVTLFPMPKLVWHHPCLLGFDAINHKTNERLGKKKTNLR